MADFHPVVWMFDEDFEGVKYNYFNEKPIIERMKGPMPIRRQILFRSMSCGIILSPMFSET